MRSRFFTFVRSVCLALAIWIAIVPDALAFCGFYVSQANANLYNQASQVIIARNGDRTVMTMANDYQGDVKDFALVVPVPVVLSAEQVSVRDGDTLSRLDRFSAPRLVEYFDPNPCAGQLRGKLPPAPETGSPTDNLRPGTTRGGSLGVSVEERFRIGEYDIVILSATESQGLETWLRQNNYNIPTGASALLQPYVRQGLKFFVAKVNLGALAEGEFQDLRPLAIAYESPRFMLPIRLGTLNTRGEQDSIVYLLSPQGQVELTNYRTAPIPTDLQLPEFIQQGDRFREFYRASFSRARDRAGENVAFLEYAWDMGSCDPCAADPLSREELQNAGVFWLTPERSNRVFITRLHLRYTRDTFPEDLQFLATNNRQQFQGRYIVRHPYRGEMTCEAAENYRRQVRDRQEQELATLVQLTGWDEDALRNEIDFIEARRSAEPWWRNLW